MGSKLNPGKFDFYENALPDEPIFVLLARDDSAPELIEGWAGQRIYDMAVGKRPRSDMDLVEEAQNCAKNMRRWREDNFGKWRKDIK